MPKLQNAGWDSDPHSNAEQRGFTDVQIVVRGSKAERKKNKRADFQLVAVRKHLPDVLTAVAPERRYVASRRRKVRPISDHGNVNEIIGKFGSADQLRNAVNQLQSLLYAE